MVRTLVQWVVFALVAYACWQVAPIYLRSRQFEEQLEVTARQSHSLSDGVVAARALELARSYDLPVTRDGITVRQVPNHTYVDVTYTADLQLLPGRSFPWTFSASVDGYVLRPQRVSDVIPALP